MRAFSILHHSGNASVSKMKIFGIFAIVFLLNFAFAAEKTESENVRREKKLLLTMQKYPEVMAEFNGHRFTVKMVAKWVMEKHPGFEDYSYPELLDAVEQTLEEKIYYTLLADFLRREGFAPSAEMTGKYLTDSVKKFPPELKKLKYKNSTITALASDTDRQLSVALQSYLKKKKPAEITVTDDQIEYFYRVNQNIFMQDAKIDIAFIAVAKTEKNAFKTIRNAYQMLMQGVLFEKLAQEINAKLPKNFFGTDNFPPELAARASQMEINVHSHVIEFPNYYAIMKVTQRKAPEYIPLKNAAFFIKTELESRKSGIYLEKLLNSLIASAKIKRFNIRGI